MLFNLHNCLELNKEELDLVILANVQGSTHGHDKQVNEKRSKSPRRYFKFKSTPFCKKVLNLVIWGSENLDLMLGFNCFDSFV